MVETVEMALPRARVHLCKPALERLYQISTPLTEGVRRTESVRTEASNPSASGPRADSGNLELADLRRRASLPLAVAYIPTRPRFVIGHGSRARTRLARLHHAPVRDNQLDHDLALMRRVAAINRRPRRSCTTDSHRWCTSWRSRLCRRVPTPRTRYRRSLSGCGALRTGTTRSRRRTVTWVMLISRRHLVDRLRRSRARVKAGALDEAGRIWGAAGRKREGWSCDERLQSSAGRVNKLPELQQHGGAASVSGGQTLRQISERTERRLARSSRRCRERWCVLRERARDRRRLRSCRHENERTARACFAAGRDGAPSIPSERDAFGRAFECAPAVQAQVRREQTRLAAFDSVLPQVDPPWA